MFLTSVKGLFKELKEVCGGTTAEGWSRKNFWQARISQLIRRPDGRDYDVFRIKRKSRVGDEL